MITLLFALQFSGVQTFLTKKVAAYLSKELGTTITVEGVYFRPFSSLRLDKVYIEDLDQDTLLYINELNANIDLHKVGSGQLIMNDVSLSNAQFYLKKVQDSTSNLTFIIDYFKSSKEKTDQSSFNVQLKTLSLKSVDFKYKNYLATESLKGVNFNDIDLFGLSGELTNIDFENHLFQASIKNLRLTEKSGFVLKKLEGLVTVDRDNMEFKELYVQTNQSTFGEYIKFSYNDFSDFSDFINKVNVQADIKDARINSTDIEFFAPSIEVTKFNLGVSGTVSGKVNSFVGNKMLIKGGQATYFRGDIKVTGLPSIDHTIFDLNIEQIASNKKDLDKLVGDFSGRKEEVLPAFLSQLGQINYSGKLIGLYNDFQIDGALKTKIGQLDADLEISLKDNNMYRGRIASESFDIGEIIGNKSEIGIAAFQLAVDGNGFNLNEINANIDGEVKSLNFKKYTYHNIKLEGDVIDNFILGRLAINDSNLNLEVEGKVNFAEELPQYDLIAAIEKADLKAIGFYKDSLTIEGHIKTKFAGNNLNNIVGETSLKQIVLRMPSYSTSIDSLVLTANNIGVERHITISSDIADVVLNGEIDLNNFPAYFKSIIKKYIPSWKEELNTGDQSFDFALRLKRAEPLMMLFFPSIQIPDTVILNGKFSTDDSVANLNGYIPMLEIGKIKVKDIILDEVAMDESLHLTLTADRVNITDSLYVKNINISNILSDDSLRFNVKLSDIDANNQLDLNGLVEFRENERLLLSLLPSNVIINREDWKLEDRVNFDFIDGRTQIKNFELANGAQNVKINGWISKDPSDVLDVKFEKFDLSTLAGLTNPLGINLQGKLNGDFQLVSVFKNPYISADVNSSDIVYNDRGIGDMTLLAEMDPATNLVGLDMKIQYQGAETLKIKGSYDAVAQENSLKLNAALEDSEIVLFEPFLKKLVSDLEGTVSADIQIDGTPLNPIISGDCQFNQASFTVNYLQTRYTINDKVAVNNSSIELDNLTILDENEHKAIATGRVDMSTPLDPNIEVEVKAENFMVLNTTAKDNALYYGKAFGSGDFSFKGLTSSMDIDIKASTEEGTVFNIPLNASGTVSENEFITFVSKDSTFSASKSSYFDGLTLHIDLDITRNAEANIFTDLGKLSGTGNGNITMNITSLGDFEMFGDYVIQQGKFTFTAQDFINKIFEISRGGTIRWTGNPVEALINLTAIYEVRTSVRPLYVAAGRAGTDQRVVAQAEMILGGNLLHPEISFAIDFPIDSYVKDELQNYFSDANNVNQQALSLIVRRSFAPGTGTDLTTELNNTFLSAGTELAFNQLNNVISQSLNLNFVDFNIRSLNEASASIRLLNNRLMLTGGVTDRRGELNDFNLFSNQVASDVEALFLIRKNGNLLLRASNRLNNRNFLNPNDEYVSALGLVYRQEFDTVGEFFRRMFLLNRKKKDNEDDTTEEISAEEKSSSAVQGSRVN
ncbi:translocation/assembly module TamB domain-containing protein [Olivibacter sp. SDN3]|uniref:translocation/assembly module TamB domain-containing protein n=1 Tax=Olivibacter sp. SDN3 TaxID=2764720 RepID=UPI0016517B52|nr:translocation/assembly module TamB domain-containing protein [Olivibacter sp. SDN3]QNL50531.1 translocation/assembly module TamB domain-containing protein [Olivibacter sp. SDN3]